MIGNLKSFIKLRRHNAGRYELLSHRLSHDWKTGPQLQGKESIATTRKWLEAMQKMGQVETLSVKNHRAVSGNRTYYRIAISTDRMSAIMQTRPKTDKPIESESA